jgi:predicted nuclease of restriction endonuclease-like (RecB) superfamily
MAKEKKPKTAGALLNKAEQTGIIPEGYKPFLEALKVRIQSSQIKAAVAVNKELITLYWEIGTSVYKKQLEDGWGAKTIEKLAKDLKSVFPGMKGFSLTNIKYMVQFAKTYPEFLISQQPVGQIPWGHNVLLMQKIGAAEERLWYVAKTLEHGWSRDVLWNWIDGDLYNRQGKAITNFSNTLPVPQSDLARQTLKDPYLFDFLELHADHNEKEVEQGLVDHVRKFLMELGSGFAFVGQQYPLEVSGKTYFIDLLLYNFKLRRFFVVEIKAKAFDPRDTGQTNFYLSAVDDMLKHPDDQPTIGLILCKNKDNIVAEYALRNLKSPIGVAGYETKIFESLPNDLKGSLPSIKEIEEELTKDEKDEPHE